MHSYPMLIDGRLVDTTERDEVINPALGAPFATCARGRDSHVDEAVDAAARAFTTWRKDEASRRAKLRECAAKIEERAQEIATLLSQEQGKPLMVAFFEVSASVMWFRHFADLAIEPEVLKDDDKKRVKIVRKPLGVVAAITPWNFPFLLLSCKLAPALLAGNTVVAKPSPFTPLTSLLLGQILKDVLPAGVVNILSGGGDVGAQLAAHPRVRKISFTGSIPTGKKILGQAAEDMKRVTLELGGNDPAIVLDDAAPEAIVDKLFWNAFQNSGQVCIAIKRLYVHEKVYEPILKGLIERAKSVKVGNGLDPDTKLGPINNQMQLDRVIGLVEDARRDGAKVEAGGQRLDSPGYFYPPTIVTDAHAGMRLVDEEQFGTALPVLPYSNLDDALQQANRTHYGLGASVWTSDPERGEAIVQEIESGTGWVNHHMDLAPQVPFGGCKWSGLGYENGLYGYREFTEMQVINTKK